MIGGAVPHDDQLVLGPFGPEPAQDIDGVLAVGAGIGPEPHLAFVVEIEAVERELVRQTRRGRGNPEAPAALRPSHSRDRHPGGCALRPGRPADGGRAGHRPGDPGSARQRPAGAPDRPGRAAFWPSSSDRSQTMQGGADRLAAAGPAEPLTHPADQTAQRPARRWIGSGYRRGCGGALGGTDRLAKAGLDLRAKIL